MCDVCIASDNAQLGLPEIKLGLFPGAGGTQRLTRIVGKSKAMDMILSGEFITANEAYDMKILSAVTTPEELMPTVQKIAKTIGKMSLTAIIAAKLAINASYETPYSQGLEYERGLFNMLTGTKDAKIGIEAFLTKVKPQFTHT